MSEQAKAAVAAVVEEAAPESGQASSEGEHTGTRAEAKESVSAEQRRTWNLANLKNVGTIHSVAVVAALALFGAAHTWAATSGWLLAGAVAIAAAYIAGTAVSAIGHEWGHFSGAVISGADYKVAKKPANYFFMFNFNMRTSSARQAIWMSWGGLTGSWLVVALLLLAVPADSWACAVLIGTVVGNAVNASVFELPIIFRTAKSGEFEKELNDRLASPGLAKVPGLVVGLLTIAVLT